MDEEIKLVLVQKSFAPAYVQLAKDNFFYLEQWLPWPLYCKNRLDFEEFIQRSLHDYADGKSMVCAIFYLDKLVGNISFNAIDTELGKTSIGYWLTEQLQGKGIITRCCQKMISIAFEELKLDKVEISAAVGNRPSRAVCERLGMTLEGVITHAGKVNGRIVDHAVYGLYRHTDVNVS